MIECEELHNLLPTLLHFFPLTHTHCSSTPYFHYHNHKHQHSPHCHIAHHSSSYHTHNQISASCHTHSQMLVSCHTNNQMPASDHTLTHLCIPSYHTYARLCASFHIHPTIAFVLYVVFLFFGYPAFVLGPLHSTEEKLSKPQQLRI